jgi:aminotransferase
MEPSRRRKYHNFISRRLNLIAPSEIRRVFELLPYIEGVVSLAVGEPDFPTPQRICQATSYLLEKGNIKYTSNSGTPELRYELARYLNNNYGIEYNPDDELLITAGVSEALDLALRAILDPGDEVIMPDPYYLSYNTCTILAGGKPVMVPTCEKDNFEVSAADIESRVTNKTKAIIIGYPANPTGAVMSRDKLSQVAEVAQRHNLVVISDEIYAKLVYGMENTCFATLPGMKERTIFLGGFSKAYAMTGWRIGYAAAPSEVITAMTLVHQHTILCPSAISQTAAVEALKSGDTGIVEMVEEYDRRRQVIVEGLNDIGLSCFEPHGAFYAFPSIKSTGVTSAEFAERLLVEEKVAVLPGVAFGHCGEGYIRCSYATSLANIEEAMSRIKRFVNKLRKV